MSLFSTKLFHYNETTPLLTMLSAPFKVPMLIDMGLVWWPHLSHFLLIKTYIGCLNGGICAVKSQFSNFG